MKNQEQAIPDFIVGEASDGNEYLVKLTPPRFIARVAASDEDGLPEPQDADADFLSGLVYSGADGLTVCEVKFLDETDQQEQFLMQGCEFLAELRQEAM